jgi:hypothetical protein
MNADQVSREQLHADLLSEDANRTAAALGRLDGLANLTTVGVLARVLTSESLSPKNRSLIEGLLRDVKLEGGGASILDEALAMESEFARAHLLALAWEAGATAEDRLLDLVSLAIESSFEVQIEVMTLVAELEGVHDEQQWQESCAVLQEAIDTLEGSETALLAETLSNLRKLAG